jgi:hypothetical protein
MRRQKIARTMESADALAAKRRVLIDALMMCLQKSRVVAVVDANTIKGVLNSAAGELWREGEFRLEQVWKILVAQPGLTAEEVAPPLLVFKAYEKELGVQVRMPQALSAIPRAEQVKLREALGIQREDFARAVDELKKIAADDQSTQNSQQAVQQAVKTAEQAPIDTPKKAKEKKKSNPLVAALLAVIAVGGIGGGVWLALRDSSTDFDTSDVAGTVALAKGRVAQGSMSATITDPKWDSLPKEEQKRLALQLLDQEAPKGIHTITLSDEKGATRALISEGAGGHNTALIP